MQTNTPWGYDDLPIITRLYRQNSKLQKGYRVTYRDKSGKKDFIGAHDKSEVDEKVKELESHGHKVLDIDILKAKVYVKNPSEVPQGTKVNRGERGGLYYESEEQRRFTSEVSNIEENIKRTMKFSDVEENEAQNAIDRHTSIAQSEFKKILNTIGGNVSYRIKNKYSILEKLKRKNVKPIDTRISDLHYPTLNRQYKISNMQDIFGIRIEVDGVEDIYNTVKKLEGMYGDRIATKEDYVKSPKGIYRAYHLNIDYGNDIYGEIQIRTPLMDRIANASHVLFYKNYEGEDQNVNLNIKETLATYSKIAIGEAKTEDLRMLSKTKEILRGFGL